MGYEETLRLIDSSINHSNEATNQTNRQTKKQICKQRQRGV